jgi:hypothetical protein
VGRLIPETLQAKMEIARSRAGLLKLSFLFWGPQLGAILFLACRLAGHGRKADREGA